MDLIAKLEHRYAEARRRLPFFATPQIGVPGLICGRGSRLVRFDPNQRNQPDHDLDRLIVLLSVAYGRQMPAFVAKLAKRSIDHWRCHEKALAQIELSFARFPPLDGEDAAFRLFVAETLLDDGMAPEDLARNLDFDAGLLKYDREQPRVPAGNGRFSGRWGANAGQLTATDDRISLARSPLAIPSLLTPTDPGIVRAFAAFASRFTIPTAILGALIIPTPNDGGVAEGTLPDAPDVRFRRDGPAGTLRLSTTDVDGRETTVVAQSRNGIYVDVATDEPLGRDFGTQLYLDLATVTAALAPHERETEAKTDDAPQLCPAPVPDVNHGAKEHTLDYEDDVHNRVNPLLPIPRGFAVRINDPKTGLP